MKLTLALAVAQIPLSGAAAQTRKPSHMISHSHLLVESGDAIHSFMMCMFGELMLIMTK
jgi:hypothetical protein